jgi:hypothetical protein
MAVKVKCGVNEMGNVLWPDMRKVFPKAETAGTAKVDHFEIDRHGAIMWFMQHRERVFEGKYARLLINGRTVMSNTWMEQVSNRHVVKKAHGKVLLAGLGYGMIILPMLKKPEVESILVIEKNPDVIKLVEPKVRHKKLSIVEADIFEWKPVRMEKWNVIYFDIWPDRTTDNLPEIAKLHQRFKGHLFRDGNQWMGSWYEHELRAKRRQEGPSLDRLLAPVGGRVDGVLLDERKA